MALKSSQPRRRASPKSEKLILRTTKAVGTPNNCSLGLANTVVIVLASLPAVAGERSAIKFRASVVCAKIAIRPGKPGSMEALPEDVCRNRFAQVYRG